MDIVEILRQEPAYLAILAGVLGLVVGSFLNVVIHRLPLMMERAWREQCAELLENPGQTSIERFDLIVPRSRCPRCGHLITALENIPLLSYLLQRGRCRHCGEAISLRYPIVEVLTAVLSVAVAAHFGATLHTAAALVLTWGLICLAFIDFDTQLLPDGITLPLLWLGLLVGVAGVFVDTSASVIGAAAGYLSLWTVYHVFRLATGKEGMGYGDFKLLALLGAWMGWQALPLVILLSSVVGALVGILLIVLAGRDRNIPIPFGPYLATAGWIVLLWGDELTSAYLRWSGMA